MKKNRKKEKNMKELGIYVHIPFCVKKCSYCDFKSYEGKILMAPEYIKALKEEIKEKAKELQEKEVVKIKTIYIGGGTPSYLKQEQIVEVLEWIKEKFFIKEGQEDIEITIEINPGSSITKEKLEAYKGVGINRISIGLQTTDNDILVNIGRIHRYNSFLQTYELTRKVGFDNINVDLMIGLPGQTLEILEDSLNKVIALNPEHISAYSLILEEGTKMKKIYKTNKSQGLPTEEEEREMYWLVKQKLEEQGYKHYEISNFAKEGYESKHNMDCWKQKEYIGFGSAAHSYLNKVRSSNLDRIEEYIAGNKVTIHEEQTKEIQMKEYMMLGLRTLAGISINEFKNKFVENPIYVFRKELEKLVKEDLLEIEGDCIKLTKKGIDLANLVWEEFV